MINVNVSLYGDIASYAGGTHIASKNIPLSPTASVGNLLQKLGIPPDERGYLFINAVLHDAPGLFTSRDTELHDGDHVGIFSTTHMWPYQYRDGIRMAEPLKDAIREQGPIQHTYESADNP